MPIKKLTFETANGAIVDIGRCVIDKNYTSSLSLGLLKTGDSTGQTSWVDMGEEADNFSSTFKIELEKTTADFELFEQSLKGLNGAIYMVLEDYEGFYPFTPIYGSNDSGKMRMLLSKTPKVDQLNIYGDVLQCELTAFPAPKTAVVYNGAISGCDNSGESWLWNNTGASIPLPFPDTFFKSVLNAKRSATQVNGGAVADTQNYKSGGEVSRFSVRLTEEKMRLLVNSLRAIRGAVFQCYFPDNFKPFSHTYDTNNYCNCRLKHNVFDVETRGYMNMKIDISLQLVEVVS